MKNVKYWFSVTAGLISTLTLGYSLLTPIWDLSHSDEILKTGGVVVLILSMILSVFTGQKISRDYTQEGIKENHEPEPFKGRHSK